MHPLARLLIAALVGVASVASADDIRDKVHSATEPPTGEAVIDLQGMVFGLPFGTSEDGVMQKFDQPAGYLRVDAHRTALLYGQSYLLLWYDGSFDGIRINRSAIDGKVWDNAVVRTYGVNGVPSNVLVGKNGRILSTDARGPQPDEAIEYAQK